MSDDDYAREAAERQRIANIMMEQQARERAEQIRQEEKKRRQEENGTSDRSEKKGWFW